MRTLVFTNMFPFEGMPFYGSFVSDEVDTLRDAGVEVDVLFINTSFRIKIFWNKIICLVKVQIWLFSKTFHCSIKLYINLSARFFLILKVVIHHKLQQKFSEFVSYYRLRRLKRRSMTRRITTSTWRKSASMWVSILSPRLMRLSKNTQGRPLRDTVKDP